MYHVIVNLFTYERTIYSHGRLIRHDYQHGWFVKSDLDYDTFNDYVKAATPYNVVVKKCGKPKHKPLKYNKFIRELQKFRFSKYERFSMERSYYKLVIPINEGERVIKASMPGYDKYYVIDAAGNTVYNEVHDIPLYPMTDEYGNSGLYALKFVLPKARKFIQKVILLP